MATVLVLFLPCVLAGYAPDEPPILPDGWCAEGTITRSTGECMCPQACEGTRCSSGQGMVWYSYKDCPTGCKCVKKEISTDSNDFAATGNAVPQCAEDKPCHEVDDDDDDDYAEELYEEPSQPPEDEQLSTVEVFLDLIDEHGRLIFGLVVILLISCGLAPVFMLSVGSVKKESSEKDRPLPVPSAEPEAKSEVSNGKSETPSPMVATPEPMAEDKEPEPTATTPPENDSASSEPLPQQPAAEPRAEPIAKPKLKAPVKRPTGRAPSKAKKTA